jgi:Fe2+ transport system protein B
MVKWLAGVVLVTISLATWLVVRVCTVLAVLCVFVWFLRWSPQAKQAHLRNQKVRLSGHNSHFSELYFINSHLIIT